MSNRSGLGMMSLAALAFLNMGSSNCGGGGGPSCPPRSSASALMSVGQGGGLARTVGSVTVTEVGDVLYIDVHPDTPYTALWTRAYSSMGATRSYKYHPELAPDWAYFHPLSDTPEGAVLARPAVFPESFRIDVKTEIGRPLDDGGFEIVGYIEATFDQDSFVPANAEAVGTGGGGGGGGPDECRSR